MKKHLQRIVSLVCVLALAFSVIPAMAEEYDARVITAKWKDGDNQEGFRPDHVDASLAGQKVTLNDDNGWTAEVSVPSDTGNNWTFDTPDGYTATLDEGAISVITYNRPTAAAIDVSGTVIWNDSDNAGKTRPESVQLMLLANGEVCGEPLTAKAPAWKVTWTDLAAKKAGTDETITYTVRQLQTPNGYASQENGTEVTNTLQTGSLKLNVSVAGAPEDADLSSMSLTVDGPDPSMPRTLSWAQVSGGSFDFGTVLPGAYLVRGTNADTLAEGYIMDAENSKVADAVYLKAGESAALTFKYTYKLPEETDAPEEYDPMANIGNLSFEILGPDARMPITVTYAQFTDGKYELPDLAAGVYTVVERNAETLVKYYTLTGASVTGMKLEVTPDGTATAKLFNQYIPAPTPEPDAEFIDVPVTKTWNDNNNKDGNRPNAITVRLFADGVEVDSHVLTAADNWAYTFAERPRYQEDHKTEIVYSVNEDPVPMYTVEINGYNLVNNYHPELTSIAVSKIWQDDNNAARRRPTSIAMTLSDGQKVVKVVVLNAENGWSATVDNLPNVVNGQPAKYAWKEQEVIGYTLVSVKEEGNAMVFTNALWTRPDTPTAGRTPKTTGETWYVFEEYDTPLGVEVTINHVGDCFD